MPKYEGKQLPEYPRSGGKAIDIDREKRERRLLQGLGLVQSFREKKRRHKIIFFVKNINKLGYA